MAKYYVQSGNLKRVVDSLSTERAAVWAVHQAMQQIAPQFAETEGIPPQQLEDVICLSDTILISEVGFESEHQTEFDTFAAFRKWYALCELIDLQ